jgi:hypothetical protein
LASLAPDRRFGNSSPACVATWVVTFDEIMITDLSIVYDLIPLVLGASI